MEWGHLQFYQRHALGMLNTSLAFNTLANSLIGLFVPIYLYELGYSVSKILLFFLLSSAAFLVFAKLGVRALAVLGVRGSMGLSIFFMILYYWGLRGLSVVPALFWVLPAFLGLKSVFHNLAFHVFFLEHSHKAQRGREVSGMYSAVEIASFLGPMVGGWLLGWTSWGLVLVFGAILLKLSILPLLLVPEKRVKVDFRYRDVWKDMRYNPQCVASFSGYAIEYFLNFTVWPIFIIGITSSLTKVGFLLSASLLTSLVVLWVTGREWDKGLGKSWLRVSSCFYALGWFLRVWVRSGWGVWWVDSLKNWAGEAVLVSWSAYNYDVAGKHFFRFVVFRETVFNLARVVFIPIVMALLYAKTSFTLVWVLGGLFSLLYPFMAPYRAAR